MRRILYDNRIYMIYGEKQMVKDDGKKTDHSKDRDSIDTLPLADIPLSSENLRSAKLVKNSRMETNVEIFSDPLSGSLQVSPDSISDFLPTSAKDQEIINKLSGLYSFDVYSLRKNLKDLGVEVADAEALELSDEMKDGLSLYGLEFISPLVEKIYGSEREDLKSSEGLGRIIKDSDSTKVIENLRTIAAKTGMDLKEIPDFLKEYSDVYMSVAYYRYSFESISSDIERFLFWVEDLKTNREIVSNASHLAQLKQIEDVVRFLRTSIKERLAKFHSGFEMFWMDINRASFLNMRQQIEDNHGSMGAVLCGLMVKMHLWKKEFPNNDIGGPATRFKFILSEMEPGLAKLKDMENNARKKLGLLPVKV